MYLKGHEEKQNLIFVVVRLMKHFENHWICFVGDLDHILKHLNQKLLPLKQQIVLFPNPIMPNVLPLSLMILIVNSNEPHPAFFTE